MYVYVGKHTMARRENAVSPKDSYENPSGAQQLLIWRVRNAHLAVQMSTKCVAPESHFSGRFLFDGPQLLISRDVVWAIHTFVPRLLWNFGLEVSGE